MVYQVYLSALQIGNHTAQRLERKNLNFSKDGGLRVGVKDVGDETYLDRTQSWFVKAWELGEEEVNANKKRKKTGTFRKAASNVAEGWITEMFNRVDVKSEKAGDKKET